MKEKEDEIILEATSSCEKKWGRGEGLQAPELISSCVIRSRILRSAKSILAPAHVESILVVRKA